MGPADDGAGAASSDSTTVTLMGVAAANVSKMHSLLPKVDADAPTHSSSSSSSSSRQFFDQHRAQTVSVVSSSQLQAGWLQEYIDSSSSSLTPISTFYNSMMSRFLAGARSQSNAEAEADDDDDDVPVSKRSRVEHDDVEAEPSVPILMDTLGSHSHHPVAAAAVDVQTCRASFTSAFSSVRDMMMKMVSLDHHTAGGAHDDAAESGEVTAAAEIETTAKTPKRRKRT